MLTMAMPPRIQPTQASASAISFSEIPPEPMSTPMVMKNGTAIRLKDEMPLTHQAADIGQCLTLHQQAEHAGQTNGVCDGKPQEDHDKEAHKEDKNCQCLDCHISFPPLQKSS